MAADEYGFDPDDDSCQVDNPFWDGTDAAHPAWWRGHDATAQRMIADLAAALGLPPSLGWPALVARVREQPGQESNLRRTD